MDTASQWAYFFPALNEQAAAAGKKCMVEEWGVNTTLGDDPVASQAAVFNSAGVPWVRTPLLLMYSTLMYAVTDVYTFMQLYWMVILGKSVDQPCEASDGACCHAGLDTSDIYDYQISLTISRANCTSLFHTADETVSNQTWSICK